jgi:hypothetical protein
VNALLLKELLKALLPINCLYLLIGYENGSHFEEINDVQLQNDLGVSERN